MTQRYMLDIAKKHNIDSVDKAIDACEFVEELLKDIVLEIREDVNRGVVSKSVLQLYADANWAVGDLAEEIEVMQVKAERLN